MKWFRTSGILSLASALALGGCGGGGGSNSNSAGAVESTSEIAASAISGAANSTEGSAMGASNEPIHKQTFLALLERTCTLTPEAHAATPCPVVFGSTCSGADDLLDYDGGCSFPGSGATWTGSQTVVFDSAADCTTASQSSDGVGAVPSGGTVTRTFGPAVRTGNNGVAITIDNGASGFSQAVSGGELVSCGTGGCLSNRTIDIEGIHLVAALNGNVRWNHSISSVSGHPIVVTGHGAGRVIEPGGEVLLQHNLLMFTAQTTIETNLTHTAGCCFPVSGTVQTAFTGGANSGKTESLAFGPSCGDATLTNPDGSTESITLRHCL